MAQSTSSTQQQLTPSPPQQAYVPARALDTPYPLIDNDPHIKRVFRYARPIDWLLGAGVTATPIALQYYMQWLQPMPVGKSAWAKSLRFNGFIGLSGALILVAQQSSYRFYGFKENKREEDMDMKEMVAKVKKGEPLYGVSTLSPYMQGVAARNSRYSATFLYCVPWFNFVNHEQHGVDTAKYYQQAERELEAERTAGSGSS